MEINKQNPFSFYDFLGYLTPGAVFLYGVWLSVSHGQQPLQGKSLDFLSQFSFEKPQIYIPLVLLAYIVGHFLSFISSITIERFSIWAHGYPSKYLLGVPKKDYFPKNEHQRIVLRFLIGLVLTPITIMDWLLGEKLKMRELYAKQVDKYLEEILRRKMFILTKRHIGVFPKIEKHGKASEVDLFIYAYHFAVENAPNHLPKMQNYVALYGFLRTLTLLSILSYWSIWWHIATDSISAKTGFIIMGVVSVICYLLFMAFVKFYRRFSLEALMAMAVTIEDGHDAIMQIGTDKEDVKDVEDVAPTSSSTS
ncbi:hypothetical protein [Sideroxydans sp.]